MLLEQCRVCGFSFRTVLSIGSGTGGTRSHSRTRIGARQQPPTPFPAGREKVKLAAQYGVVGVVGLTHSCTLVVRRRGRVSQAIKSRGDAEARFCAKRCAGGYSRGPSAPSILVARVPAFQRLFL